MVSDQGSRKASERSREMKKIYRKLTKEQRERGVIFSSTLSTHTTEQDGDDIHEVFWDDRNGERIDLLLDDRFFQRSPWKYNIIRR